MKNKTIASKYEKSWTVLLVDGQGRIRRIRNFRQKSWAVAGLVVVALIATAVMGVLYGGSLRKQVALTNEVGVLQKEIIDLQQKNELLKVRAIRMEAQMTKPQKKAEPKQAAASVASPAAEAQPQSVSPVKAAEDRPPAAVATPEPAAKPAAIDKPEEKPEEKKDPQVDVEGLKLAYLTDTENIEVQFVIRNTGKGPAGGRTVVVLKTEEGRSQLRFAVPSVPLRDGQPLGNRGRRFSISRFMTLTLKRKFAEPGTQFVAATVYAYTLEGKNLLEKAFEVNLTIPKKEVAPDTVVVPPPLPDDPGTTAAPLGLTLPDPKPEEKTGAQP